ncbi:hypothetical protein FRC08_005243 [Ceratobasidium sp. 394]|nr:hypothetical protein FRC08_005243 [Ceratobasidium sp. 394]
MAEPVTLTVGDTVYFRGTFECIVCLDSRPLCEAQTLGKCGHVLCESCLFKLNCMHATESIFGDHCDLQPFPCPSCKRIVRPDDQLEVNVRSVHNDGRETLVAQLAANREKNAGLKGEIEALEAEAEMYASLSRRMAERLEVLGQLLVPTEGLPEDNARIVTSR